MRYSRFFAAVWIAVSAGLSIAPSSSAVAADKSFNLLHRLAQLRDRAQATRQSVAGIHSPGDAVVTGFSGVRPPQQVTPGINPLDKTFIDLDGPSVRVIDLSNPGASPQGQVMAAPKPFTVTARQIGQVFAVAQDDATPPNIYAAATSAYGLPIVAGEPDRDGSPRRLRRGEAGARFMPGLFGPQDVGGGPGSIWKIDGRSGAVSLFANIPNSGAGLGDIVFDAAHRQFFVSDRASGLIHRIGLDGVARGTFDHGVAGRAAVGLVPVPDHPERRLNIQSPAFDPGDPQSWNLPTPARRTFGLAVFQHRLFYAVAEGLQVWSVGLTPDGGFAGNASWELSAPLLPRQTEVASILFDAEKQIYLAQRGAPTGTYDFKALTAAGDARVLRYRLRQPSDPPRPGRWAPLPDEYAVGFRPNHRNTDGGLALGYRYTLNNAFGGCGGTLWTTGDRLRGSRDPALARQLAASGPLEVKGVQGVALDLLRPRNVPPLASLFANYDERLPESIMREQTGHMGDIAIWQSCGAPPPRLVLTCPIGFYWNGFTEACELPIVAGFACPLGLWWDGALCVAVTCPADQQWNGRVCVCPPNATWNGRRCVQPPRPCPEGATWDESGQRCVPPRNPCPVEGCQPPPRCNMPGQIWDNGECVCPLGQHLTRGGCVCPRGEYWNGTTCDPNTNGVGVNPPPSDGTPVTPCPPGQLCPINPPDDQQPPPGNGTQPPPGNGTHPPGSGNGARLPPGDRIPPPGGDRLPPLVGITPPPAFCQGAVSVAGVSMPFKLVGGTCCMGNYTCTMKPTVGTCPSGTVLQLGPPLSSSPICCRSDTAGTCAPPPQQQQQPDPPRCEPVGESKGDRCWRWFGPKHGPLDPVAYEQLATCNAGGAWNLCFANSDCAEGACCGRDGYCRAAGSRATSVPPPPATGACPSSMIRVGETCCTPESIAAGLCGGTPTPPSRPGCTGGKIFSDNACRCPSGTIENARGICVKPPSDGPLSTKKKKEPVCKRGFHREDGRCVPNVRRRSSPEPTPQAVPNIGIDIGIGIGGGVRGGRGPRGPGRVAPPPRGGGGTAN